MQKIKKIGILFCIFVMTLGFGSCISFAGKTESKPDEIVKLTNKSHCRDKDVNTSTTKFIFNGYGYGLCAYGKKGEPQAGDKGTMIKITNSKANERKATRCLYYFYKHKLYENSNELSHDRAVQALRLHRYISFQLNGWESLKPQEQDQWSSTRDWVNKEVFGNDKYDFKNIPDWFETYYWQPKDKSIQPAFLFKDKHGKVSIQKKSGDTDIDTELFKLKGIQYDVFYDKEMKQKVGVFTLDENGKSNTLTLTAGTYYIKEVDNEALKNSGLELDVKAHDIKVIHDKTKTVVVNDNNVPTTVTIQKEMQDGSKPNDSFKFLITNVDKPDSPYILNSDSETGKTKEIEVEPGTYEITEKLTEEQEKENIEKVTKPITVTLNPGDHKTFKWINKKKEKDTYLQVTKESLDGANPLDFKFKVTGVLKDGSVYKDEKTGKNYTELEPYVRLKVKPGTYTVTEMLTPEQKAKYHHNDGEVVRYDGQSYTVKTSQTLKIEKDTTVLFKFVNVPTEVPPSKPSPVPEIFPEFEWPVHKDDLNPGWDGNHCSGMGDAGLDPTMVLKRKYDGDFFSNTIGSVKLDVWGLTQYLRDIPWKANPADSDNADEIGLSGDNSNAKYLNKKETKTTCAEHDKEFIKKVEWEDEVDYEIEETDLPAGRFNEKDSGTGTGKKTFHIKYYAKSVNQKNCECDKDDWSDIEYRIEITDDKGRKEVLSGTKDDASILKYGNPDEFEITFTKNGISNNSDDGEANPLTWINDNYRGDFQLVKTIDDEDPFTDKTNTDDGVKKYSTKSKWTIQLKLEGMEGHPYLRVIDEGIKNAPGNYERYTHKYKVVRDTSGYTADNTHPLELSEDGQLYVYDIPYGRYIVKEISADNESYVKEQFEINITKDGQKISKTVNNQRKKNKIKVVKTNSETDKTVRWDATRTAFRIRYKGNPALFDPTSAPHYNSYLPNGSNYTDKDENNYTFFANANGEIVLPYQLEYGIYEIEEITVPKGYYVGKYNGKGEGSIADISEVKIVNKEGKVVTPPKGFLDTVQVKDADGKNVTEFTGNNKVTFNKYRFTVLEQDDHIDGESYKTYYASIKIPNNPTKGKITINKTGEALAGWKKDEDDIFKAVWGKIKLAKTKFEIYAAKDIMQSDGVVPVEAYLVDDDSKVELEKTHRDHADVDDIKEIWEKDFQNGIAIKQTKDKGRLNNNGKDNKAITDYLIGSLKGATFKNVYYKKDDGITYKYTVTYSMNYSKGGFNYTDVHVIKESISDDYVADIKDKDGNISLLNGEKSINIESKTYDNGNIISMNKLEGQDEFNNDLKGDEIDDGYRKPNPELGNVGKYNTDDIKATVVDPAEYDPQPVYDKTKPVYDKNKPVMNEDGSPKLDKEGNQVYEQKKDSDGNLVYEQKKDENGQLVFSTPNPVELPEGYEWCKDEKSGLAYYEKDSRVDENGKSLPRVFMASKKDGDNTEYQIYVLDNGKKRWIPCTEEGKFYKSYKREYSFTMAQHYKSKDGFTFNWDDIVKITAKADNHDEKTETVIEEPLGSKTPEIIETPGVYEHKSLFGKTTFTGRPLDKAFAYFKTNDGIKTEMYLSGGLTHTKVTVTQKQLMAFDNVYPEITYNGTAIDWRSQFEGEFDPDKDTYEKIINDKNYLKAIRHEVTQESPEVYYTIELVSDNSKEDSGFKITYPDTTTALPLITKEGEGATLRFISTEESMEYPIGKPIEVIETNEEGIAESPLLPIGEYWVREISSTTGHINKEEWRKVDLNYKDQYTPIIWNNADYENEAVPVKVDLEKFFEVIYNSAVYEKNSGAIFGIYTTEDMEGTVSTDQYCDEKKIPADTLVGKLTVTDGHADTTVKLPLGRYYIKEISVPDPYKLNGTKYYFDVIDPLTADTMKFHYKDMGIRGHVTQNGEKGIVLDLDVLYRHEPAKITISDKEYLMNQPIEDGNVTVTPLEGRTNLQLKLNDGDSSTVKFENGSEMTYSVNDQSYTVTIDGTTPTTLETGSEGNENFTRSTEGSKTIITYNPKVVKTNWLSEVSYKYNEPEINESEKDDLTTLLPANKDLTLTSPGKTSAVTASVDYNYNEADLEFDKGTVTSVTIDEVPITNFANGVKLKRVEKKPSMIPNPDNPDEEILETDENGQPVMTNEVKATKATINFDDGVTFTVQFDEAGNFYMDASGIVDKNLDSESILTVDGEEKLPRGINLKNTTKKTYARNNTSAGVLNVDIKGVKNDKVPEVIGTTATDSKTKDHFSIVDKNITIVDKVSYSYLVPGKEYTVKGVLMDKDTGEPILVNGKEVTSEKTFVPKTVNGYVNVKFNFDGSGLIGKETVVFEELYMTDNSIEIPSEIKDAPVAVHKDIEDHAQTIKFYNPEYNMFKVRTTKAQSNGHGKYGFLKGDKVSYDVHVVNTGDVDLTMDVTDSFENKDYFSIPVVKKVENATWNNKGEGNKNLANITVKAGETAIVTYQTVVTKAKVYLAPKAYDNDSLDKDKKPCNYRDQVAKPKDDGWTNAAKTENVNYKINKYKGTLDNLDDVAQTPIRKKKGPNTGDNNKPYIYGGVLIIALTAAGFVIYKKKKDN